MSCGDLSGIEIRPQNMRVPVGSNETVEAKFSVNAPSCAHGITMADVTRSVSFGTKDDASPDVWYSFPYAASDTPGTYVLEARGDHYANGWPVGPITAAQVTVQMSVEVFEPRTVEVEAPDPSTNVGVPPQSGNVEVSAQSGTVGVPNPSTNVEVPAQSGTVGVP